MIPSFLDVYIGNLFCSQKAIEQPKYVGEIFGTKDLKRGWGTDIPGRHCQNTLTRSTPSSLGTNTDKRMLRCSSIFQPKKRLIKLQVLIVVFSLHTKNNQELFPLLPLIWKAKLPHSRYQLVPPQKIPCGTRLEPGKKGLRGSAKEQAAKHYY